MAALVLTADLGNSRCKLRLWELGAERARAIDGATFAVDDAEVSALSAWLEARAPPAHAALSSVGAPEFESHVRAALERATQADVLTPSHGLELDVREAHTLGADRLFAARGALRELGGPALVVDAGTALTVDALDVRAGRGVFRGGAIAPGPQLLAEALARSTARLPRIAPKPGVRALGKDTHEAIESGVVVGFRGAARELIERVGRESGLPHVPLALTGGARAFLLEPPLLEGRRIVESEDLVHLGLLAALADALGSPVQPARESG